MELQEQITALTGEKKHLFSMIENLNCEKVSLDQMLVNALKETLAAKKDALMKENSINNLNNQIQGLLKENETLKAEIEQHINQRNELQVELDQKRDDEQLSS
jgi:hypothetical protein